MKLTAKNMVPELDDAYVLEVTAESDSEAARCRALWVAVIENVVRETVRPAIGGTNPVEFRRITEESDRYIRDAGANFRTVCENAGFDPDFIRDCYVDGRLSAEALKYQRHRGSECPKNRGEPE